MEPVISRRAHPEGARFGRWHSPDGWAHRRMDWPQPPGAAARGTLLFAGGRGDFIEKYLEALAHWHGGGWNVAAFDWRGQGGSRGSLAGGNHDSFDPLIGDLAAMIDELAAAGPGPLVAVAHSMGGHVLLRTLAERRPPLAAAVLVAPMIRINSAPLSPWMAGELANLMCLTGFADAPVWQAGRRPQPAGSRRQAILTSCPERYADEAWWWEREPGFNLGVPSWRWMRAAYRSSALLTPEALRAVPVPVLLLGAPRDRLVSAPAIEEAARLLPAAELEMIAEAAHEILREADPVRLRALARIDAFLDARAPAR
jgi:lysophospholipase